MTLAYSRIDLDRAGAQRSDPQWVADQLVRATVLPLWRDRCLLSGAAPVALPAADATAVLDAGAEPVLLGVNETGAVFAVDLSAVDEQAAIEVAGADEVNDLRGIVGSLDAAHAAVLACARGVLFWHRNQQFCGACGARTQIRDAGHHRSCPECGKLHFPRIEPAVIVLVEASQGPRRCLLGRHRGAAADQFSTLAGFVEIGESLEEAVRREVAEESGVAVDRVTYQASQAWPFPSGLMVGFHAVAASDEIAVDEAELIEARWFTEDELAARLAALRRTDSIERLLMQSWLSGR